MTNAKLSPLKQAFLALQDAQERVRALEAERNEPIAIVGIGCRIPAADDGGPEAFWTLLAEGRDAVSDALPARWRSVHAPAEDVPHRAHFAALLKHCDEFDAAFFGISPREAASMDPQQRLLLEIVWEALENASIAADSLYSSSTGVFVGIAGSDYSLLRVKTMSPAEIDGHFGSGLAHSIASGRISYLLGLRGPSLSIDTACSSSLVTVHLAVEALRRQDCNLALAGGVNVIVSTEASRTFSESGMLAADGRCKSFSAAADGFVRGEGCGVVVLKRLRDAVAVGDRVLAVIRGSAVNNDGPSSGLTVPNGLAQQALLRRALKQAGVAPSEVGYVEAHGTGTSLGDPIEAEALGAVMDEGRPADRPLLIGSVKTNIGHLEAAAGVAGLIKVVLALQHGQLPAQLHWNTPSPHIRWDKLKLRVVDRLQAWEPINGRRLAGVSSFGFSGTNAHVVLEEAPSAAESEQRAARPVEVLPLSAKSAAALRMMAAQYRDRLRGMSTAEEWADLCFTAGVGRSALAHRLSVRAKDAAAAASALDAFVAGNAPAAVARGEAKPGAGSRVGFLLTGQGAQYAGMGAALYAHAPRFRQIVDEAEAALAGQLPVSLGAVLRGEVAQAAQLINETLYTQPALYVLEYGLAMLWQSLGVRPVALLGHSLGEYVGCAVAGVFGFKDGLRLVADRARLMHGLKSDGAMLVVVASEAEIGPLLNGQEAALSLAGINAAKQVTVSGERRAIEALASQCAARGWRHQTLPVSQAFHSPLMAPIEEAFAARAGEIAYSAPLLPVISNVTGKVLERVDGGYWRRHLRQTVRFSDGLATLAELGCDVLLELGPKPVLLQLARQAASSTQGGAEWRYVKSLKGPGMDEWETFSQAVQELHAAGAALDWAGWHRDYRRRKVDAPLYPFERQRYWISASGGTPNQQQRSAAPGGHPLLGTRLRSALPGGQFEAVVSAAGATAWLGDHRIAGQVLMPATGLIETMLAAGEALDERWNGVEDLSILAPLVFAGARTVQTVVDEAQDGRARVRIFAAAADAAGNETPAAANGQLRFRLHAEATLVSAAASATAADLAALRRRCVRAIDSAAHYRRLAERGAIFGQAFRNVQQLWAGDNEALGEITVALPPLAGIRPHPAILDACLQVAAATLADSGDTFVPVALARFAGGSVAWPASIVVHARLVADDPLKPVCDFTIYHPDGDPLAQFDGLAFHNVTAKHEDDPQSWLYELGWETSAFPENSGESPAAWIVVGAGRLASSVAAALEAKLRHVTRCADAALETVLSARHERRGVVYLPPEVEFGLEEAGPMSARSGVEQLLRLSHDHSQRGVLAGCRLYVVTRKVHAVRPSEATLLTDAGISGLAASLFNEFPELRCTRIDIDPAELEGLADQIARELLADASEDWVAYRSGRRFLARLCRVENLPRAAGQEQRPIHLVSDRGLDGLEWRALERRALAPNEIEVEIRAAALNFRDVVGVVGLLPAQGGLGSECAGVVTRIGDAVTRFRRGDPVVAIADGSLASFAIAPEVRVMQKPAELSFEVAAAQNLVYLTADHCLNDVAGLRAGERVLIHAAAGGVGLAAVQLCLLAGAEVYATASSPAKHAYLRALGVKHVYSSRTLDFVDQIRAAIQGRGVDIVLNSIAGDFVDGSLTLLRPGGRFVEIGKMDIRDPSIVAAAHDVVYRAIDLTAWLRERPMESMQRLGALLNAVAAGELAPVPHRAYEFADAKVAFRDMAAARQIGKLVLVPPTTRPLVRREGAYLVTGGAAGVGFVAAEWLAEQGAGRIILLSRQPPAPVFAARIARWCDNGVEMIAIQGDAADRDTIAAVLAEAGPALRGVIHCANVLDDAPVGALNWERFDKVMRPKALGAWHLHHATASHALDFFVLFSSWAAIAGKRGGANYAAASLALDSLAHRRRHQGLPALSIDWGAWADVGWAARLGDEMPEWPGFSRIKPNQALAAMGAAIRDGRSPQVAIAPIDWPQLAAAFGRSIAAVWSNFITRESVSARPAANAARLCDLIAAASATAIRSVIVAHLQRMAAAALGIDDPLMINPDQPLQDLGLDSIMAADLRSTLAHALDRELPTTLLFDHPTINSLADFSVGAVLPIGQAPSAEAMPVTTDDLLELIETLSDEEVDARLVCKGGDIAVLSGH